MHAIENCQLIRELQQKYFNVSELSTFVAKSWLQILVSGIVVYFAASKMKELRQVRHDFIDNVYMQFGVCQARKC